MFFSIEWLWIRFFYFSYCSSAKWALLISFDPILNALLMKIVLLRNARHPDNITVKDEFFQTNLAFCQ